MHREDLLAKIRSGRTAKSAQRGMDNLINDQAGLEFDWLAKATGETHEAF
jgi:hypothetical protein